MTRGLLALGWLAAACAPRPAEPSPQPGAASPAAAPTASAGASSDALWERCRETVERRCTAANPEGGEPEQRCRDKLHARFLRIRTPEAQREYLLALGCRPATVD